MNPVVDDQSNDDGIKDKMEPGSTLKGGSTSKFFVSEEDVTGQCTPSTWSWCDGRTFNVRIGPDYATNKMKSPSKSSLYDVFAVDGFRTKKKVMNIARFFR